jgi:integrase
LAVKKRGKTGVWWCDFQIRRKRVRLPIPEARTKHDAEQAEIKLKRDVFEGKYGREFGTMLFGEFVGDPDADQFDLRATYGTRLGEAGFNAYDIAKLMGHASITTSQRYVRNLPVGAGEAVMLKNQRHKCGTSDVSATFPMAVNG